MIISYFINKIKDEEIKENIAFGLAAGLAFELAFGLAAGLIVGLAAGLAFGLTAGLIVGLTAGLAFGLIVGLTAGLAFELAFELALGLAAGLAFGLAKIIILNFFFPYWIFIILILIITEVLFLFDKRKLEPKKNRLWFTLKLKLEAFFESLLILTNILNVIYLIEYTEWEKYYEPIKTISFYILIFFGIIGLLLIWLYLNSLRYKNVLIWLYLNSLKYKNVEKMVKRRSKP